MKLNKTAIGGFIGFIVGISGNILADWLQKVWFGDSYTPINIGILLFFSLIGIIIGSKVSVQQEVVIFPRFFAFSKKKSKLVYWIGTFLIIFGIIGIGIYVIFFGNFPSPDPNIYFVIDSTETVAPFFENIKSQVLLATNLINDKSKIGIRVFGGTSNSSTCPDSFQLLEIGDKNLTDEIINSQVNSLIPQGHGSMIEAAISSILFDLNSIDKPTKLIIISSGIDSICDPRSGDLITKLTQSEKVLISPLFISIGVDDENAFELFNSYAEAFGASYIPIKDANDIPKIVEDITHYGYGYPYGYGIDE